MINQSTHQSITPIVKQLTITRSSIQSINKSLTHQHQSVSVATLSKHSTYTHTSSKYQSINERIIRTSIPIVMLMYWSTAISINRSTQWSLPVSQDSYPLFLFYKVSLITWYPCRLTVRLIDWWVYSLDLIENNSLSWTFVQLDHFS